MTPTPTLLGLAAMTLISTAASADPAIADIPVKRVVLYSSGVGYIEHGGQVDGAATATLRFTASQVNDVLKSLLLEDLDGGKVGAVVYPSQDPVEKQLRSFQVDLTGNPGLAQLLNQLRGATVTVQAQAEKLSGTILGVEAHSQVLGTPPQKVDTWHLNLVVGAGIRQVPLDSLGGLTLDDPKLQAELGKALAALANARDQDKKPVTVAFNGNGKRRVRLGYVVESPVWKTSYRLVLPDLKAKSPEVGTLQGWAIVENQTDADWTGVELRLISGRPISFIQDLYRPLYLQRPTVEPEVYAALRPVAYSGGMASAARVEEKAARRDKKAAAFAAAAPAALSMAMEASDGVAAYDRPINPTAGFAAVANTEKLGEQFQYAVPEVTLPRQRSAMLPIIGAPVQVQRLSIYNQGVQAKHPLSGALLTNTTGVHLQQGPMTVLDTGAYAGDARIDDLAPDQQRLISFAIDLPVLVDAESSDEQRAVSSGKLVRGVLYLQAKFVASRTYKIRNQADADRLLVIEHPARRGWTLVETPEPWERAGDLLRFKLPVAKGATVPFTVRESLIQSESVTVTDLTQIDVLHYAENGALPAKVREALAKVAQLKQIQVEAQRQRDEKDRELQSLAADQSRLRENLRTVERNSPVYQRMLGKVNEVETRIEAAQNERERLNKDAEQRGRELADWLGALVLE
ncbi:hypothetical protein LBMAG53_02130 [Planctomycetota bacterium]|nr:hypothetical protein LBMAG53_02130 [Planctomycetota bacterium]